MARRVLLAGMSMEPIYLDNSATTPLPAGRGRGHGCLYRDRC